MKGQAMNYDERLQDTTEHYEEQGYSERDARKLATRHIAAAADMEAQEAWEAAQ